MPMNAPCRYLAVGLLVPLALAATTALAGGVARAEEPTYEIRKTVAPAVVGKPAPCR